MQTHVAELHGFRYFPKQVNTNNRSCDGVMTKYKVAKEHGSCEVMTTMKSVKEHGSSEVMT